MARMLSDFHLHTHRSDGSLTADDLLRAVRSARLVYFAVTDHDTLRGWSELRDEPGLIPGVEATAGHGGREVHIVGLGFDPTHPGLTTLLERIRAIRHDRLAALVERLPATVRGDLTAADVIDPASDSPSRLHLARVLVARKRARSINDVFERWLGDEYAADGALPSFPPIAEVAATLHAAGGVALLAHPGIYGDAAQAERFLAEGLDGLEVDHPNLGADRSAQLIALAQARGWLMSAGSDLHFLGARRPGMWSLPADLWRPLHERLGLTGA
jgi:predicted metal-dependent phosphoesterase TrpH